MCIRRNFETYMIDERQYRDAMSLFPSGVTVVAADDGHRVHGLTVSSFASVSLSPPLCLVCIRIDSSILPIIRAAGAFSANFLAADQAAIAELFARGEPRERHQHLIRSDAHPPRLDGVAARIEMTLHAEHGAGDHQILVGEVTTLDAPPRNQAKSPLTWWRGTLGAGVLNGVGDRN